MEANPWKEVRQAVRRAAGEADVLERRERGDGYERVRLAVTTGGDEVLRAEFFVLDAWPPDDAGAEAIGAGLEALGGRRDMPVLAVRELVVSSSYRRKGIGGAFVKGLFAEKADAYTLWPQWAGEAEGDFAELNEGVRRFWMRSLGASGARVAESGFYLVAVKPGRRRS